MLEKFSEILGFDGLEKSSDVQMTEIINRVRHLSPEAWEEFSGQLSRFRSRTPISYNSVTQEQRKKLFEDIGAILTPIEAKAGENDSTSTE